MSALRMYSPVAGLNTRPEITPVADWAKIATGSRNANRPRVTRRGFIVAWKEIGKRGLGFMVWVRMKQKERSVTCRKSATASEKRTAQSYSLELAKRMDNQGTF